MAIAKSRQERKRLLSEPAGTSLRRAEPQVGGTAKAP